MIIQCEQCRTKFRLDDSRIRENGVKVRCAKCRHVFTVMKEQPGSAPPTEFGELLDRTPPFSEAAPPQEPPTQPEEEAAPQPAFGELPDWAPSFDGAAPGTPEPESPFAAQAAPAEFGELPDRTPSFSEVAPAEPESPFGSPAAQPVDLGETDAGAFEAPREEPFSFEPAATPFEPERPASAPQEEPPPATPTLVGDEFDFGAVNFGTPAEPAKPAKPAEPAPFPGEEATPPPQSPRPGMDTGFGDLFESTSSQDFSAPPTETAKSEPAPPAAGGMEFGDIFEPLPPTRPEQGAEPGGVREFVFEPPPLAAPPAEAETAAPPRPATVQAQPEQPVSVPQEPKAAPLPFGPAGTEPEPPPAAFEEELPPLSIPSRRRESSLLKILLPLLLVALIGAAAFYGKDLVLKYWPKPAQETGSIVLRSISSTFVRNANSANELLVISGEAVNSYATPRAALQVKGMVYDDKDQVLLSKNAFCGNPLSKEQLASMPLDAIEVAMANQLGSGLTNLEVPPGKAIPFTVVITGALPAGARNFGVEPAGSQAVDQKSK